ncbi:MAG: ADOP family duplicated permease [Gemmatimonadaceae bacterium]
MLDTLLEDVRFSWRSIERRRAFSALLVATIALGIGTATAMFSLVDGVLLKPLPFRESSRLVMLFRTSPSWRTDPTLAPNWDRMAHSLPHYLDWVATQRSFDEVAAWKSAVSVLGSASGAEEIHSGSATASFAPLLGIRPALGRWFLPGEDGLSGARVAVLSHESWRNRFGMDSAILGRALQIDGELLTVVGVLPPRFQMTGAAYRAEVWTPAGTMKFDNQANNRNFSVVGLLRLEATVTQAELEAGPLLAPATANETPGVRLANIRVDATRSSRRALLVLLWSALLLLVMTCGNVATLLVGRTAARSGEIATRIALGARGARLAQQLLTENAMLAGIGAAFGVASALALVKVLKAFAPDGIPRMETVGIDMRVATFTLVVTCCVVIFFSLAPLYALLRTSAASVLGSRSSRIASGTAPLQRAGLILQCAVAVVLLVASALLVHTHRQLAAVDVGFRPRQLLGLRLNMPRGAYPDAAARRNLLSEVVVRVSAMPGVTSVAVGQGIPFLSRPSGSTIHVAGSSTVPAGIGVNARWHVVSKEYFGTLGIPLQSGRPFAAEENHPGASVIVSETMARRFWPNTSAIGQRIKVDNVWRDVIGVVGDVRAVRLDAEPPATFYLPMAQTERWADAIVVRTTNEPFATLPAVRAVLAELDPTIAVGVADRISDRIDATLVEERFRTILVAFFAIAAAVLAAIGVFAVASDSVARRVREFGVRIALGSTPSGIVRLVIATVVLVCGLGAMIGGLAAGVATRLLQPFLYGVSRSDVATYAFSIVLVVTVAVLAAWLPAYRASRLQPMSVLRAE